MATKDFSFSTKKKKNDSYFKDSSNDKYRNLNLNLGHKYSDNCFGETKSSKFNLKNDSYKFSGAFNSFKEEKNKSLFDSNKSWKIPFQLKQEPFGSRYSNISEIKDNKKSKNAFDSRDRGFSLSDHIQKNMHLYESPAAEDKILIFKKDKKKFKNAIEKCLPSSADLQDSWEFPRQQKEDPAPEPEVMQFTASQKLLRPSQEDESRNDQLNRLKNNDDDGDADDDDDDDDGAGSAYVSSAIAREQSELAQDNSLIGKKFKGEKKSFTIESKIAKGSFGTVFSCREDGTKNIYAIKCIAGDDVNTEIKILKEAKDAKTKHIYHMIESGKDNDRIFIVIDLLGRSLSEMLMDKKGDEWDTMKWKLAEQCLIGLQNLHELGYLHLDIKQNNFAMGLGEDQHMVYLIDFGSSMKSGSSRKQSEIVNSFYSSIAAMEGKKLGPKDDLESLMYLVNEFLGGQLPWDDDEEKEKILEMKKALRNDQSEEFKKMFGEPQSIFVKNSAKKNIKKNELPEEAKTFPELLMILRYVDSLKAEEVPEYDKIFYFLHSAYEKAHQKALVKFDMEMDKLKDNAVEREELQKKWDEKDEEIRQLSVHCRSIVQPLQNAAFFTAYDYDDEHKTESNPKGKYYSEIEFNGLKMTLKEITDDGNWYEHELSGIEIKIDGKQQQQLGGEAKILEEKKQNEK